jgi:hypothetical protein
MAHKLGQHVLQATKQHSGPKVRIQVFGMDKSGFMDRLATLHENVKGSDHHTSCPIIYEGCSENSLTYIGGYGDFRELARQRHHVP